MKADRPGALAARIREAINTGRLEEAAALLEAYVRDRPHRADEQFLLASTWINLGRINPALDWLNRTVVLKPQHGEAQLRLGRNLLKLGRASEAERPLRCAIALAPSRGKPLLALGACLNRLERWSEAEPLLSRASAARSSDPWAHYEWGLALLMLSRPGEGAERLTRAAALDPGSTETRLALARSFYELGQTSLALSHVEAAIGLDPMEHNAWLLLGSINFARSHLDQSCHSFWRALAFYPSLAESHFHLGRSLAELDRNADAAAAFSLATSLRPDWVEVLQARGTVLLRGGRLNDAAVSLAAAATSKPQWAVPRFQLGNILLDLGRATAAASQHAAAACLAPDSFGRHLAHAPLSAATEGPIASLEGYARDRNPPTLALSREARDDTLRFACVAVGLDRAAVMGGDPLILTEDGTMLAGGIGYNPNFACDQIRTLSHGWYIRGRSRYAFAASAEDSFRGAHLYLGAYHNFGHWLYNSLSRLAYAEQHSELRKLPLAMPDTVSASRRELFAAVGYGAERITLFGSDAITRFERLWVPATLWQQPPQPDDHSIATAVGRILPILAHRADPDPGVADRRLYIPRGKVMRRRVSNEPDVLDSLQAHGFEILDPSMLSLVEQIRLVRRARIIAAPMGAAATIVAFAQPSTSFIDCKIEGAPMDVTPFLCSMNGIRHLTVLCRRAHVDARALFDDFEIPIVALEQAVKMAKAPQGA